MPRFDDGMVNMAELVRVMVESLVDEIMGARADEAREAGNRRSGYRMRRLVTSVGTYVHSELQKAGVMLKLLHEEYRDRASADGLASKSYTTFCRDYAEYVTARNVTNHLEHKPGQVMEVDWNGTVMWLESPATLERTNAYLFVACLPYPQYSYVEATLDMKQGTWVKCHVHAYRFFGGVPVRTVCDNLKTGVVRHPWDGEVVLNEAYEALGRHYVTAIMPTGVRKPKQKASVEGACGKVATAIVARLRNESFATLADLNDAISVKLDEFNAAPFQKRDGSRRSVFDEVEAGFLAPLPDVPFEVCSWVYGRSVNLDFHVVFEKNSYSVPYGLVGGKVDLKIMDSLVDIRMPDMFEYRAEKLAAGWGEKRVLRKYAGYKVLVLDEFLIDKPTTDQMHFLLELTELRYDCSSTIFCTQYPTVDWHRRMGGGAHAESVIDRIVHNAVRIEMGEVNMRDRYRTGADNS